MGWFPQHQDRLYVEFWKERWLIWAKKHQLNGRQQGTSIQDRAALLPATAEDAQVAITRLFAEWELRTRHPLLSGGSHTGPADAPGRPEAAAARERIIQQLAALGPAALEPLAQTLCPDTLSSLRVGRAVMAALALGRMGDIRAVPALLAALRDQREGYAPVRAAAARALGELKAEAAATLYRRALMNWSSSGWQAEAGALGTLRLETLAQALVEALSDTSAEVRAAAADAFVDLCLADPLPQLSGASAKLAPPSIAHGGSNQPDRVALQVAVEPLIQALKDENATVRTNAAAALGWIGSPRAAAPLAACLKDADERCRGTVALALGMLGMPAALRPLARAMGDPSAIVRQQAAEALGELGDPVASDLLLDVLDDRDEPLEVRAAAARALGNLHVPQVLLPLRELLGAPEPALRMAAIEGLGRLGFGRAYRLLTPFLWHDPDRAVRHAAARAIARLAEARQTRARWRLRLALRVDRQVRKEALMILNQHTTGM
jgi:HEAT repeat protein